MFFRWAFVECPFLLTRRRTTSVEASDKLLKVFVIELAMRLWIMRNVQSKLLYVACIRIYICFYIIITKNVFFFQQRPLDNRRRTTSEDTPRSQCDNISNFFLRWAIVKCPFCLTRSGTTSIEASDKLLKVFVIELAIQLWITRNMRISSYALRVSAYICAYIFQIRINHMLNMRDMRMCAYRFQIRISYWCLCIK